MSSALKLPKNISNVYNLQGGKKKVLEATKAPTHTFYCVCYEICLFLGVLLHHVLMRLSDPSVLISTYMYLHV